MMWRRRRRALMSIGGLLVAGFALSACGANAGQRGELATVTTSGTPIVPATHGSGSRDLGTFSGTGRVTVVVSCVGPGTVSVTLKGIDLTVGAPCVPSRSESGGSQSAIARVHVASSSAFTVRVAGESADRWVVAVSEDQARPSA